MYSSDVLSSYRPLNNASPETLKSVEYRSQYLPTQSVEQQRITKSNNLRPDNVSILSKASINMNISNNFIICIHHNNGYNIQQFEIGKYTQPLRSGENHDIDRNLRKMFKNLITTSLSVSDLTSYLYYSQDDSKPAQLTLKTDPTFNISESENKGNNHSNEIDRIILKKILMKQTRENDESEAHIFESFRISCEDDCSGNNSSPGSGSLLHSVSMEEIQNERKQLKVCRH